MKVLGNYYRITDNNGWEHPFIFKNKKKAIEKLKEIIDSSIFEDTIFFKITEIKVEMYKEYILLEKRYENTQRIFKDEL